MNKPVMIFPNSKRERAINNYSKDLISKTRAEPETYTAGSPWFFPIPVDSMVHVQHEYNLLGWYGIPWFKILPLLKMLNDKLIVTMHTVNKPNKFGFVRRMFYKFSNWIIKKTADKVIVHSNAFKQILVRDYNFNPKQIVVIRQGVKKVPGCDKEAIKKELGLKGKVYLIIGNFHKSHRPHVILSQAAKINGTVLVVWNSNAVNDRNKKRLIQYYRWCMKDKTPNVKTINLAKEHRDKWWEFFHISSLVLLPYVEGVGSGIFQDAMATRTPVVCSKTTYFNEILSESCGMISKDKDFPKTINQAMLNLKELKKGCETYSRKYSVSNQAKKHWEVYNAP
jgi:glycosyltransferase involved in cell wall biosynthesis